MVIVETGVVRSFTAFRMTDMVTVLDLLQPLRLTFVRPLPLHRGGEECAAFDLSKTQKDGTP